MAGCRYAVISAYRECYSFFNAAQRTRLDDLRRRLEEACTSAGLHVPLDPQMTRPPILKTLECA